MRISSPALGRLDCTHKTANECKALAGRDMAPVGDSPRPTGLSKPTALAGHGRRRTWPQRAPHRRNRSCYVRTPRGPLGQLCLTSRCRQVLHLLAPARQGPSLAHADRQLRVKPAFPALPPCWAHLSNPTPPTRPLPPPDEQVPAGAGKCCTCLHLLALARQAGAARRRVPGPDNGRPRSSWLPRQVAQLLSDLVARGPRAHHRLRR